MKGKRTRRQRAALSTDPLALTMACSSSEDRASNIASDNLSSSSAGEDSSVDRAAEGHAHAGVEEDMANCLILLSRGETGKPTPQADHPTAVTSSSGGSGGDKVTGVDSYRCKTCDRCFSSFQALGGHRASHKKPRPAENVYDKLTAANSLVGDADRSSFTALSLQIIPTTGQGFLSGSGRKPKVHECSICRAEFTSGQALGGHMRRHRTPVSAALTATGVGGTASNISFEAEEAGKNSRNVLRLDLNLPAPEGRESELSSLTMPKDQVLVFSASPLVDCYY